LDTDASLANFVQAVHCPLPVTGHTHNFYRYPARFSPHFARAAIQAFSQPGDTVLDPFMGGGTTAVESLLAGRRFIGSDLNPLAVFVSLAKITPLSKADVRELTRWAEIVQEHVNLRNRNDRHADWATYQRHMPGRQRKLLEMALDTIAFLTNPRQRRFARCTLMKTAQWAMDCRLEIPGAAEFRAAHWADVTAMLAAAWSFGRRVGEAFACPPSAFWRYRRLLCRPAAGLEQDGRLPRAWLPVRLVLTSPPYVGVHVLYHRWQVQGRRESPAPYWLADSQDGRGSSHYTFGDRRRDTETYMSHLRASFESIAAVLDKRSLVVQLVAFSQPRTQLEPYLEAMRAAGFVETSVCGFAGSFERVWRIVPNRKWYARVKSGLPARKEVLLIHKKRTSGNP
jgi:hypothetical protein